MTGIMGAGASPGVTGAGVLAVRLFLVAVVARFVVPVVRFAGDDVLFSAVFSVVFVDMAAFSLLLINGFTPIVCACWRRMWMNLWMAVSPCA